MATRDSGLRTGTPLVVSAALAAAAGFAVLVLTSRLRRGCNSSGPQDRELLLSVLKELSRRFFFVCQDVAAIAKSVRTKIAANKVDITDEKLTEQLRDQCKVYEKLNKIQREVAEQFGLSTSAVEQLQQQAGEDDEVQSYGAGFKAMLDDALEGKNPVLSNVTIPEGLTEEKALSIQSEVQEAECQKVIETVSGGKCSLRELGEVLAMAHKFAWDTVLVAHSELLEGGGPEVYHSAVATYSRNNDFAKEKKQLEDRHQQRMIKMFQPDKNGFVKGPPPQKT